MPCIDLPTHRPEGAAPRRRATTLAACLLTAWLAAGCSSQRNQAPAPVETVPTGRTTAPASPSPSHAHAPGQTPAQSGSHTPAPRTPAAGAAPALPPITQRARHWDDYRLHAARRIVAANPQRSYDGEVQQPALAIPVLEIEVNADGSVRRVVVMRQPSQARDTVQLAIDAVHRAAPFGPAGHLPRPWKFTEVFLFNDQRRFKPRTLDD